MVGIYKIENKINGKVYIGKSIDIDKRWYSHRSELNGRRHYNNYLQNSWNKYGENNFFFEILELCQEEELNDREKFWIETYYSNNPISGYNLTSGGDGGWNHHVSDEVKEKLSKIQSKEEIVQLDLDGNLINRWRSSASASRTLNVPVSGIRQCVLPDGDQYQCHGYIWLLSSLYDNTDFSINDYIQKHLLEKKSINQFDLYGNIVRVWKNTEEIRQVFSNSDYKSVFRTLNHSVKSANGYIYLYADDDLQLTDDYLLQCRIDNYTYKFKQINKNGEPIKVWNQEELRVSDYKYNPIRICCTKNRYQKRKDGKKYSSQGYIWEYD